MRESSRLGEHIPASDRSTSECINEGQGFFGDMTPVIEFREEIVKYGLFGEWWWRN